MLLSIRFMHFNAIEFHHNGLTKTLACLTEDHCSFDIIEKHSVDIIDIIDQKMF